MSSMRDVLQARGLPVSWLLLPGGHTYGVWRPGLADALAWTGSPTLPGTDGRSD
jgi:enterochelin esterase-like enzyme